MDPILDQISDNQEGVSLDSVLQVENTLSPDDDPRNDPILPSQMTSEQKIPNERPMNLADAMKAYKVTEETIRDRMKAPTTHFWGNAARGVGDFAREIATLPERAEAMAIRAFNGHVWPDMTEEEAIRLMDSSTRAIQHDSNMRQLVMANEGADQSFIRPVSGMAAQVVSYGLVGALTGGVGIGLIGGLEEASSTSQEMAEDVLDKRGTLAGHDNTADTIFSAAHGALSGYIESKLGVERLFTDSIRRTGIRKLGQSVLTSAAGEGVEEYLQESSKYLFQNMAGRNNRTFGEFQRDAIVNAAYGALLGGAFGGAMYPVNIMRLKKSLVQQGYTDEQAAILAPDMVNGAKEAVLREVDVRSQIREHYGEEWDALKNKISTQLENAGWKETHPEVNLDKYAEDNADDITGQLFRLSNSMNIDTHDLLELSDIEVVGDALRLRSANLNTPEDISTAIGTKQESIKSLNLQQKTEVDPAKLQNIRNTKSALNTQIKLLQRFHQDKTGQLFTKTKRLNAAKTRADANNAMIAQVTTTKSAFDVAPQATNDVKLLAGTTNATEFMNKMPMESYMDVHLPDGRVNQSKLNKRYNEALMMWLLGNDTQAFEELYFTEDVPAAAVQAVESAIPEIMRIESEYPTVGLRADLAATLKKLPALARYQDFAFGITQNSVTDGDSNLFNENALLYILKFGKNINTMVDGQKVGYTISEFFDKYAQTARMNQEQSAELGSDGHPLAAPMSKSDILAETLTNAFPREFVDGVAQNRDMKAVFLTRAQSAPTPQQFQQDNLDSITPSLFPDTTTAAAVNNLPWNEPVNVQNPIFFSRKPDAMDLRVAKEQGYDAFLLTDKNSNPTSLVLLDGRTIGLKPGAAIPTSQQLFASQILKQTDLSVLSMEEIRGLAHEAYPQIQGKTDTEGRFTINDASGDVLVIVRELKRSAKAKAAKIGENRVLFINKGTTLSEAELIHEYTHFSQDPDIYIPSNGDVGNWALNYQEVDPTLNQFISLVNTRLNAMDSAERLNTVNDGQKFQALAQSVVEENQGNIAGLMKALGKNWEPRIQQILSDFYAATMVRINADPEGILLQSRGANGFYDPELEVIVLGRNSNTGTLPHEMAHFWANRIFQLVKGGNYSENTEFMSQAMGMFRLLGVGMNQQSLTREQQESFATMTEAVIFGMAPVPQGMELPTTAFLNWIPPKYKSILDIGYRNSKGEVVNPILDKYAVEFFNNWYANASMPALQESPMANLNSNAEDNGRIIPSTTVVMRERESEMTRESNRLKTARTEQTHDATEETPTAERAAATGALVEIERGDGNIERSAPPPAQRRGIISSILPGKGTNTRQGMFDAARKYLASDRANAEAVAFGSPITVLNDTGVDRAILIRALMEEYKPDSSEYGLLYHNLAETVSIAGKSPGLSNDMNFQYYLDAVRRITDGMEATAAIKYAGTGNINKAVRTFNSDIDVFIAERAQAILSTESDSNARETALMRMFAEARVKFGGSATDTIQLLNQEDLKRGRSLRTQERAVFTEWATKEIKKMLKASPDTNIINETMILSERAEKARKLLDSDNVAEAEAAGKVIREWQMYVKEKQVPETMISKIVGGWYPKAMLWNINTHSVNMVSNTINLGVVETAMAAQYGKNDVDPAVISAEIKRQTALYNSTLIGLSGMSSPTSPTLLRGEQYDPRSGKSTLGKITDFSMDLLGKEDNFFRTRAFTSALGRIASADARKTNGDATALFQEYKKINNPQASRAYEARQEALHLANIAVFQQQGVLASNLKKMQQALNFGRRVGIGNLLAPFIKTPANIIEQGARALMAPISGSYHAATGQWDIQDTISSAYFVLGMALTMGLMSDYEPPYEVPQKYDPNKPYDSIRIRGTDIWIKLDTFGVATVPMRIMAAISSGKGWGIAGAAGDVPLIGDLAAAYDEAARIERDPYKQGTRFAANWAYNRVNTMVPAIIKQTIAAAHLGDAGLENIETGLPKTGIGRKIARQYGLAGGDTTTNDILRIFFNRLRLYKE